MNSPNLLTLSISPVQSFISEARKARDLFAGSQLLSELSEAAMQAVGMEHIILPQRTAEGHNSFPNQFVAELQGDTASIRSIAKSAQKAVKRKLHNMAAQALEAVDGSYPEQTFYQQLDRYFTVYWAVVPIENGDYLQAFKKVLAKLAAAKNLRAFEQQPELGRKCSLTGSDNALFYMRYQDNEKLPAFAGQEDLEEKLSGKRPEYLPYLTPAYSFNFDEVNREVHLLSGEGLSATAFLKRFFRQSKQTQAFESTAEVAAMEVIEAIKKEKVFKDYKAQYEGSFDAQLLYEENVSTAYFEKHGLAQQISDQYYFLPLLRKANGKLRGKIEERIKKDFELKINQFTEGLDKVKSLIASKKDLKQSSYYALLLFDADGMGKWLLGDYLQHTDTDFKAYHKNLSERLSRFTSAAKTYVDNDSAIGRTVYAGGDDFLGFLNLSNLFTTLTWLRREFDAIVNTEDFYQEFPTKANKRLSFSAGLVIAHYKAPLPEIMKQVRAAEQSAKSATGKDAISIVAVKHSGERESTTLKWGDNGESTEELAGLSAALDNDFSTNFISVLYDELKIYEALDQVAGSSTADQIIATETKRLLRRSCQIKPPKAALAIDENNARLEKLMKACLDAGNNFGAFLSLLKILDFLKRKAQL